MRCKNCGWPNKAGLTQCTKCGAPLDMENSNSSGGGYSPTVNENNEGYRSGQSQYGGDDSGLKKTILEDDVFGPQQPSNSSTAPVQPSRQCPKCGYPLREGSAKCPNCNYIPYGVSDEESGKVQQQAGPIQRRPTRMDVEEQGTESQNPSQPQQKEVRHHAGSAKFNGTINPYMMNMEMEPVFTLRPLQRVNERTKPEIVELEGKEVVLSRDNTEPNNSSITSKEQAVVKCENGKWTIKDLSEQHTTFVCPKLPVELKDGDIILLGNRLFEFHVQD